MIGAAIATVALVLAPAARAQGPAPLDLVFTPHATGGADSYLGVRMTLATPGLQAGEGLVRLPLKLVGIPSARYDGDALTARDAQGPLILTQSEEPPTPQGVYRRWSVDRATVGDVVVTYKAPPRQVTAATNNGPLFDLREEAGGFAGAGVGFLAAPVRPGPWRVRLHWDLSGAPAGSLGVSSMGEGDVETVRPSEALAFSYYAVGPLKRYPAAPDPKFGMYWLSDPPFPGEQLGARVRALYGAMAAFFDDSDAAYRVFIRQNPYLGTGGTALSRSFMFGYNAPSKPTAEGLHMLVAHEMAHTWPAMQGEHGDTAWYSEGAAEFYSLALSYRAGALKVDRVLEVLNERADAYYSNPYVRLTNPEAAKMFWTDPIAQTVPYGRGFMYLVNVDAQIRAASGGRRSLDDVVKAMYRRQAGGQTYGVSDWLSLVGAEIGAEKARAGYDQMVAGGLQRPEASAFAGCLVPVRGEVRPFLLGFARASLNDDRVIRELDPVGPAAAAGLRNGDVITEVSDVNLARKDAAQSMRLTVRRGGEALTFDYLPRGSAVESWRWARTPGAADGACRF